jgi:Holliday junction resolvase RusA-like endonuclease
LVTFNLPFPPSSNTLFRNAAGRGKRIKTARYSEWITEAGWQIKSQRVLPIAGPVKLTYELQNDARGPNKLWDYENRCKATTDLLVEHGIIQADHRLIAKELTVKGTDDKVGVRITIEPLP